VWICVADGQEMMTMMMMMMMMKHKERKKNHENQIQKHLTRRNDDVNKNVPVPIFVIS
jgi:hypothetical protein